MSWIRRRLPTPVHLLFAAVFVFLATACASGNPEPEPDVALEVVTPTSSPTLETPEESLDEMPDAQAFLTAGLAQAAKTDRLVFLHSGAEWCDRCKRLEAWLVRKDIAPIFSKDFVDVRIMEEMAGGPELINAYIGDRQGGFPWMAILDPDGNIIVTSNAPDGRNIGSPQAVWEIEHWNTMMRKAAKRITEEEIQYMGVTLAEGRGTP